MLTTMEGTYKVGKVELDEKPEGIQEQRVLVTFLENGQDMASEIPPQGQMIRLGMFPQLQSLTDKDFQAAEFHGDPDDGLDWSGL